MLYINHLFIQAEELWHIPRLDVKTHEVTYSKRKGIYSNGLNSNGHFLLASLLCLKDLTRTVSESLRPPCKVNLNHTHFTNETANAHVSRCRRRLLVEGWQVPAVHPRHSTHHPWAPSLAMYMKHPSSGRCGLANVSCEYGPHKPLKVYGRISDFDQTLPTEVTNAEAPSFGWDSHSAGICWSLFHVHFTHSCMHATLHCFFIQPLQSTLPRSSVFLQCSWNKDFY